MFFIIINYIQLFKIQKNSKLERFMWQLCWVYKGVEFWSNLKYKLISAAIFIIFLA